mmetsp:Transcript_53730/g.165330  ORF Transcript_53730/g.165330 Transcript_53730/m.165330 type:complete len:235 (-) Transcript_53730:1042-1746(-)
MPSRMARNVAPSCTASAARHVIAASANRSLSVSPLLSAASPAALMMVRAWASQAAISCSARRHGTGRASTVRSYRTRMPAASIARMRSVGAGSSTGGRSTRGACPSGFVAPAASVAGASGSASVGEASSVSFWAFVGSCACPAPTSAKRGIVGSPCSVSNAAISSANDTTGRSSSLTGRTPPKDTPAGGRNGLFRAPMTSTSAAMRKSPALAVAGRTRSKRKLNMGAKVALASR